MNLLANKLIFLSTYYVFLTHSICIYYRVWGGIGNRAQSPESTYSADTAFCYVQRQLYDRT